MNTALRIAMVLVLVMAFISCWKDVTAPPQDKTGDEGSLLTKSAEARIIPPSVRPEGLPCAGCFRYDRDFHAANKEALGGRPRHC
jgi:hypothetical protein